MGFPHSEISGSKVARHLPGAYRRHATSFIAFESLGIHHMHFDVPPHQWGGTRNRIVCCYRLPPRQNLHEENFVTGYTFVFIFQIAGVPNPRRSLARDPRRLATSSGIAKPLFQAAFRRAQVKTRSTGSLKEGPL